MFSASKSLIQLNFSTIKIGENLTLIVTSLTMKAAVCEIKIRNAAAEIHKVVPLKLEHYNIVFYGCTCTPLVQKIYIW